MPANVSQVSRYERKFVLGYDHALGLNKLLTSHPSHFRKAYPDRQVNNIYYDTADFTHFRENIVGVTPRKKVRIRWYGKFNDQKKLTLEIKSKEGEVVSKSAKPFTTELAQTLNIKTPGLILEQAGNYQAVLKNSYIRQYFVTANKNIRLTVDRLLHFDHTNNNDFSAAPRKKLSHTIVELKYPLAAEEEASKLSNFFPFRLNKSSKYEQGVSHCYPHLVII